MHVRVQEILKQSAAQFSLVRHDDLVGNLGRPIRGPQDFAEAVQCQIGQVVKTLLVRGRSPERLALVALPAAARLNLVQLAALLNCSRVEMASPEVLASRLGYPRNGVSPFGGSAAIGRISVGDEKAHEPAAGEIPLIVDTSVVEQSLIYVGSGEAGEELVIAPAELQRIVPTAKIAQIVQQ